MRLLEIYVDNICTGKMINNECMPGIVEVGFPYVP